MTINIPLLRKALEHITEHPEEHNQLVWARRTPCGTAYCLAGHVANMTGHVFDWERMYQYDTGPDGLLHGVALDEWTAGHIQAEDGYHPIEHIAMDELGLTHDQAYYLFHSDNTIDALWALANRITNGEIAYPRSAGDRVDE